MRFRSLAVLATALALSADAAAAQTGPAAAPPTVSDADPARFADQIAAFAEEDRAALRPPCQIVFTGSSSIRRWDTLGQDLAPLPVLNRGFGGSRIADVNHFFAQVVGRYRPAAVVFYAGENDLAAGKDPAAIVADFEQFLSLKDEALGETSVYFIALKPSKLRWDHFAAQSWINDRIGELAEQRADLQFIDVVEPMLEEGRPKEIFVEDDLHMTPAGYVLWTGAVKPVLDRDAERLKAACQSRAG
jgi:lysophospholipase L1-like esterase